MKKLSVVLLSVMLTLFAAFMCGCVNNDYGRDVYRFSASELHSGTTITYNGEVVYTAENAEEFAKFIETTAVKGEYGGVLIKKRESVYYGGGKYYAFAYSIYADKLDALITVFSGQKGVTRTFYSTSLADAGISTSDQKALDAYKKKLQNYQNILDTTTGNDEYKQQLADEIFELQLKIAALEENIAAGTADKEYCMLTVTVNSKETGCSGCSDVAPILILLFMPFVGFTAVVVTLAICLSNSKKEVKRLKDEIEQRKKAYNQDK